MAAFRILAAGMRKANARNPKAVAGPNGPTFGYDIDLSKISVAEENIFYNYDSSEPAVIKFKLNNGHTLSLYFPESGVCTLIADASGEYIRNTLNFKKQFNCRIGFVPILGPVEHNEVLYEKETAHNSLYNYRAARNFRNIWYHYQDNFAEFQAFLQKTWPGMDIKLPEISTIEGKKFIHMYCLEDRITREIFWSGFGFQVWCQMLTHVIQNQDVSLFLIDEPDIYLHADLQRQLIDILRSLGPDIMIATHSTEMITEACVDDIVLVNKNTNKSRRIKDSTHISAIFTVIGSTLNPTLTQVAKTKKVIFVEGKDFSVISRFAKKLRYEDLGNKRGFAVISMQGFNPDRARMLKFGIEEALGTKIFTACILDRDYRSSDECDSIKLQCSDLFDLFIIHQRKEIENYLLVPTAMAKAAMKRAADRSNRTQSNTKFDVDIHDLLIRFCRENKSYVAGQLDDFRQKHFQKKGSTIHKSTIASEAFADCEEKWSSPATMLASVPGKSAINYINGALTERHSISINANAIIDNMLVDEIPRKMKELIENLDTFVHMTSR